MFSSLATAAQALLHFEEFFAGEDSGGLDGAGVGYARFDFVREEAPVEGEGALPFFELLVEWFAEAAGPHLCGLLLFGHLVVLLRSELVFARFWWLFSVP